MSLAWVLTLGAFLFSVGVYGVLARRNAVLVLMSIELMLNSVNINLIAFNAWFKDAANAGQIFALFIITIAAAEVGVGLAIVLLIFRNRKSINVDEVDLLKW
ncbi:MAG: NADH-quinone oxidoreductase subunit NuoK [Actinomycetota bacterium]|nr:NADH-quinone oxidoreductase subunit NuoK [Actinomycetota bacterium]